MDKVEPEHLRAPGDWCKYDNECYGDGWCHDSGVCIASKSEIGSDCSGVTGKYYSNDKICDVG